MHPDFQSARQAQHFEYRPAIDGLRGIAVLAVLGFHAFSEHVPGGFVGVDVFFVVSGYLITDIISRQLRAGQFTFADFYARRVRRLFPALVLVLAATLIAGWFVLMPDELERLGKHIAAAALFVANIALWRETGYFDIDAEFKPLLHLWSLGIEEQFYLVWPVLLVLLWRRRSLLNAVLAALVLASLALSITLAWVSSVAAFYLPVTRFWELGAGCLLALSQSGSRASRLGSSKQGSAVLWTVVPVAGLALIATAIWLFDESTLFPSWRALLPVIGTVMILCTPEDSWFQRRVLATPALVYVGLISYALYLWHWPLLSFARILQGGTLPYTVRWTAVALAFVLAALTYHFVEIRVRRRKELQINVGLASGMAAACLSGVAVYTAAGVPERFDHEVQALRHESRLDELCRARFGQDARINYCRTTSEHPPDVVVLGDSRAQAIYEAIAPHFAADHAVMLLARGGCPPLLNVRIRGYDHNEQDCEEVWRNMVRYVERVKPRVVIVVGSGSFLITNPRVHLRRVKASLQEGNEAVFEYGLRSLIGRLTSFSQVIHVGEIPRFHSSPACFLRPVRLPTVECAPSVSREDVESGMAKHNAILSRLQATYPSIRLIDSVQILCTENVCSQWRPGGPVLYSDAIHLSPAGARILIRQADLPRAVSESIRLAQAE